MIRKPKSSCQNNLANIRDDLGYTQKQMGEILGVSERMIQKYESKNNWYCRNQFQKSGWGSYFWN